MKKFVSAVVFLLVMAFASAACAEMIEFPNGLVLDVPAGWKYKGDDNGNAMLLAPNSLEVSVENVPYKDGTEQQVLESIMEHVGASDYSAQDDGTNVIVGSNGAVYAVRFYRDGTMLSMGFSDFGLAEQYESEIDSIFNSYEANN